MSLDLLGNSLLTHLLSGAIGRQKSILNKKTTEPPDGRLLCFNKYLHI